MHAQQFHLLHLVDGGQLATDFLGVLPQLLHGIAITGQGVDGAKDIVKAVIVIRSINPCWQVLLQIVAKAPDITPGITNGRGVHIIPQGNVEDAGTGTGGAL